MINDQTTRKLREMNLSEMIDIIRIEHTKNTFADLSFDESMQLIIDYVYNEKITQKIERLIRTAKLRYRNADISSIIYEERALDKKKINEIGTCCFMNNHSNVIFEGFAGGGKTYCACAIGKEACKQMKKTKYIRIPDLLAELDEKSIQLNGRTKLINQYNRYELLILDEWLTNELNLEEIQFLFEIIERRSTNQSTIFCTQYKTSEWHEKLGAGIHAEAIIDRVIHNCIIIKIDTINMREKLQQ